jgi:hypothetical protein
MPWSRHEVMKIDLKRLRSDITRLKADRVDSPIGKRKTGATEIIREHFDELERMHYEDGASWNEIAAGLAAQGVTQGKGEELTGRRLTALMHNIRIRRTKLKTKGTARQPGSQPPNSTPRPRGRSSKTVSLSPEMSRPKSHRQPDQVISEDELRRDALAKHAHLIRKR